MMDWEEREHMKEESLFSIFLKNPADHENRNTIQLIKQAVQLYNYMSQKYKPNNTVRPTCEIIKDHKTQE